MQITDVIAPQMMTRFNTTNFKIFVKSQSTIPTQSTAISHQNKIIVAANKAIVLCSLLPFIQYPIAKFTRTRAKVFGSGLLE